MLTGVTAAEWGAIEKSAYSSTFAMEPGKDLQSIHAERFDPIGWTGRTIHKLTPTTSTSSANAVRASVPGMRQVTYAAEANCHFLCMTIMDVPVPNMELKEKHKLEYRFKLVDDYGYKMTKKAVFGAGLVEINTVDTHSQIWCREKLTPPGDVTATERRQGLHTVCKEWVTKLEATTLYYKQQFYYGFWTSKGFPAYLLGSTDRMFHRYDLMLDILRLINVEKFDKASCKWVLQEKIDRSLFVEIPILDTPALVGVFSDMSPVELESRELAKLNTFYTLDMVACDVANKWKPGMDASTALGTFTGLVQVVFWALENVTHEEANITCNYTMDALQTTKSLSPIVHTTLKSASNVKCEEIAPEMLEAACQGVMPNAGSRNGIAMWSYVPKVGPSNNGGTPAQLLGTTIKCRVASETGNKKSKYTLICRALVAREMVIEGGKVRMRT